MPSHIYIRVGRYADAIEVNADAVAADERLLGSLNEVVSPLYRFGYYPHNLHFLLVNAQFAGRADLVVPAADKLATLINDELAALYGVVQAVKTAPYSAHAQFSDAKTILGLADPGARFPFVQGFWRYARAMAHLRGRDFAAAQEEADKIGELIEKSDFKMLEDQYLPARAILDLARNVIEARIAQSEGDNAAAISKLEKAAEIQDGIPYMEPAYWYYPVRQTLAAVLLQAGKPAEAEEMFKRALAEQPRNGTSLWGLMQAQTALGQAEAAAATKAELDKAWQGAAELLDLDRL
jgi:tetratricopeptide (TPR) repeat protein